jgi:hypothetical protein
MPDGLPTPRTTLRARYVRVLLTYWSCKRQRDADLATLVAACRGDVPLVQLRWRCSWCHSSRIGAVMTSNLDAAALLDVLTGEAADCADDACWVGVDDRALALARQRLPHALFARFGGHWWIHVGVVPNITPEQSHEMLRLLTAVIHGEFPCAAGSMNSCLWR